MLAEPLKSLGKNGKTLKIARKFLEKENGKKIQKGKEKKIRVQITSDLRFVIWGICVPRQTHRALYYGKIKNYLCNVM